MLKKLLIISSFVIALIFIALIGIPYLFRDKIKALAKAEVEKRLNAKVSFEEVNLSLIRNFPNMSVGLEGFRVVGKGNFSKDTLANVESCRAVVDIKSIWEGKEYQVKKIILDKPIIHAIVDENGKANWDIMVPDSATSAKKDTTKTRFKLNLSEYRINHGDLLYEDATLPMKAIVRNLNHSGKGNFTESIYDLLTETGADTVFVEYQGIRYLNKNKLSAILGVNMDTEKATYKLLDNEITINDMPLHFSGTVIVPDSNINIDLQFEAPQTDFKNLLSLIPSMYKKDFADIKTDGKLSFSGIVKGEYNEKTMPSLNLALKVENGRFQYPDLPTPVTNINVDMTVQNPQGADFDKVKVDIRRLHADFGKNPLEVHGTIAGLSKMLINAAAKGSLNLGELTQMFPIEGTTLKGNFDIDATVNGIYDTLAKTFPKVDAKMKLANGYVKQADYPVQLENMNFQGTLHNATGTLAATLLDISQFHFDLDKKPFEGRVKVENFETPKYDAQVKGSLDLAKMTQIYPIEGMNLAGLFSIDGFANGVYDEKNNTLPKIDAKMSLNNGYVKNEQYHAEAKNISFNGSANCLTGMMADGKLNIDKFHLELDNEPLDGKIFVQNFDKPLFDANVNGSIDLEKILKIYPLEGIKMVGKILIDNFATKGSMADVEAGRYLNMPTSGKMRLQNFRYESKDLAYPISVNSGEATFSNTQMTVANVMGMIGKTDYVLNGNLTNYMAFALLENEQIGGNIDIQSKKLNVNEWMGYSGETSAEGASPSESGELSAVEVPAAYNLSLNAKVGELIYDNLKLNNFQGQVLVANKALLMKNVIFQTLGGNFTLNGMYDSKNIKAPLYGMDIDIRNLVIVEALKYFPSLAKLAPILEHIKGKFNTNVKMTGDLKESMSPILEHINGTGFFEVIEGKLVGSPITAKMAEMTKIGELKEMTLNGAKSTFDIKDGWMKVAPFDVHIPQKDIHLNISGRQNLGGALDYLVKIDAAFGKIGQAIQEALGKLGGLDIFKKPPQRIKVDLQIGGTGKNPKIVGIGKGTAEDAKAQIEEEVKNKAEDVIKQQTGVNVPLNKDTLKQKVEDLKDRALDVAKEKAEEIRKQAEEEARKKAEEAKKKAEIEAQKRAEELKKKAEDARKRAQDSIKKALDKLKGGWKF